MNPQAIESNGETRMRRAERIFGKRPWAGRILTGLITLFLLMDGGMKLFKPRVVVESTVQLGYAESSIVGIGMVLLACTVLYILPRTAILGALMLTGYLGGAVASQVRVGAPIFSILFPAIFACLMWAGLALRDRRLGAFVSAEITDRKRTQP